MPRDSLVRADVAQHVALRNLPGNEYPRALMGVVAHARQAFLDAGWHARKLAAFDKNGGAGRRPAADPCLEALAKSLNGSPVAFDADTVDEIDRASTSPRNSNSSPSSSAVATLTRWRSG